jgi:hypothetical protein
MASGKTPSESWRVTGTPPAAPAVPGLPKALEAPRPWKVKAPHGKDLVVHSDTLRQVSAAIQSSLKELDDAVSKLRRANQSLGSLGRWSTGKSFAGNLDSTREGFVTATAQTSGAHGQAAKNLYDAASTYEEAEQSNTHLAKQVNKGGVNSLTPTQRSGAMRR